MMKGMVFAERYQLEDFIGQGGMSLVYRAVDVRTGHSVAVKILKSEYNGDKEFLERFQREAQAASLMSHHNLAQRASASIRELARLPTGRKTLAGFRHPRQGGKEPGRRQYPADR